MTASTLRRLLTPRSIAVIGASSNPEAISAKPLQLLAQHGYAGALYAVNPRHRWINGVPCYPDVAAIGEPIDLAVVVVPAQGVLDVLQQCAEHGAGFAVIISSGFAEIGDAGNVRQREIKALCERTGLRVLGPNAQGYVNLGDRVAATFSPALQCPELLAGDLGFVSQSGAFGFSAFSVGQDAGIGFSHVITTGNEADITWLDAVDYLIDDERTRSIAAYVEGIRDGHRFPVLAQKALAAGKPLIVLKVGRTQAGSRAAASHTAAITGADAIFEAACRQYGVQRVRDVTDIFDCARVFSAGKRTQGRRLGILTTSGGAGVMAADEAGDLGLEVEPLGDASRRRIEEFIPAFGSAQNPVDVTAEVVRRPESFRQSLRLLLDDERVDMLAVVLTMVTGEQATDRARDIVELAGAARKPVAVSWSVGQTLAGPALRHLRESGVPLYATPVRAVRALKAVSDVSRAAGAHAARAPCAAHAAVVIPASVRAQLAHPEGMTEHEARQLLACYGIPVVRETRADSPAAAVKAAQEIGYPVALKAVARGLQHKTQAGGVRLNLGDGEAVRAAAESILADTAHALPEVRIGGLLVQEMVVGGTEMILGMLRDPELGTTVMVGSGGIFVELIRDVSYRLVPIDRTQAEAMVDELKSAGVLAGARGRPRADRAALVDTLCRLSALAADLGGEIRELEINPLIVLPEGEGVRAVDALVIRG